MVITLHFQIMNYTVAVNLINVICHEIILCHLCDCEKGSYTIIIITIKRTLINSLFSVTLPHANLPPQIDNYYYN